MKSYKSGVDSEGVLTNLLLGPGYCFRMANKVRFSPAAVRQTVGRLIEDGVAGNGEIVYDPFCGNATILYTLSVCFPDRFKMLYGSDAKQKAVEASEYNLNMTFPERLRDEIESIGRKLAETGSRKVSVKKLSRKMCGFMLLDEFYRSSGHNPTPFRIFAANVMNERPAGDNLEEGSVGLLIFDPPYSRACPWYTPQGKSMDDYLVGRAAENLSRYISPEGKMVIFSEAGTEPDLKPPFKEIERYDIAGHSVKRVAHVCVKG